MSTIPLRSLTLSLAPLLGALGALAATPNPPAEAEAPSIELEGLDGSIRARELRGLHATDPRELGAHLVRFRGLTSAEPPRRPPARLELTTGDRLFGDVIGGEGEELAFELIGGLEFEVTVETITSLEFPARLRDALVPIEPAEEGDRLYRRRGGGLDRIDGTLEEFDAKGVTIDSLVGRKRVPWSEVAAFFVEAFEDEPFEEDASGPQRGVPVVCDMVHQSRLLGRLVELDQSGVRVQTGFGPELVVPCRYMEELLVDDGALRFLSDVEPVAAREGSPFGDEIGMRWPHRPDSSVVGGRLRVGGETFSRGIGVHAPSRLTWRLDGGFRTLFGAIGIDDSVARLATQGSVRFRVLVDGEKRFESGVLRYGDPLQELPPIDVSGGSELTLEADMATEFFQGDRANWLRMRLVR